MQSGQFPLKCLRADFSHSSISSGLFVVALNLRATAAYLLASVLFWSVIVKESLSVPFSLSSHNFIYIALYACIHTSLYTQA